MLNRGYSYTTTTDGHLVASVEDVTPGQNIVTRVKDGSIDSVVAGDRPPDQMDLFTGAR